MRAIVIHSAHDLRVETYAAGHALPAKPSPGHVRVRMAAGGICGSDLHYFHHGGFGTVRVREPMALGHEASGIVSEVGEGVTGLAVGTLVAVNPSDPCGTCHECARGKHHYCINMQFNGSAMRFPHVQGLFREWIDVPLSRAFAMQKGIRPEEAALCEPLAVCLHAVNQAGDLKGKTVLVTGCGPIGILTIVVAKLAGAKRIIATDIMPQALTAAKAYGATDALNVAEQPDALAEWQEGKGKVDIGFECSGSARAYSGLIAALRPGARLVLVGIGGDATLPVNVLVAKELQLVGTFRFNEEFAEAARLIGNKLVDLTGIVTATYPMGEALAAFEHATDKSRGIKIAIRLDSE
jgi:L-idonate 5-dehydrogenase